MTSKEFCIMLCGFVEIRGSVCPTNYQWNNVVQKLAKIQIRNISTITEYDIFVIWLKGYTDFSNSQAEQSRSSLSFQSANNSILPSHWNVVRERITFLFNNANKNKILIESQQDDTTVLPKEKNCSKNRGIKDRFFKTMCEIK